MTIRTATYDDTKFKIVPLNPTIEWQTNLADIQDCVSFETIKNVIVAAPEYKESQHPLDTPLPCYIKIGAGTIKKGSKLSVLVARMNVLYEMAWKTQLGIADKPEYKEIE